MMDSAGAFKTFLGNEAGTVRLGECLGAALSPGDVVFLYGDLGAGKSTLARAAIRAATGDRTNAPSPTFTLVQTYAGRRCTISHIDLYRLSDAAEVAEIGLDDEDAALIIEWPERLDEEMFPDRLEIHLSMGSAGGRHAAWQATGPRGTRIAAALPAAPALEPDRAAQKAAFLADAGWSDARIAPLAGDASPRRYDRLSRDDATGAVLMDAPPETGEDVAMFAAMTGYLRERGFSAPRLIAEDIDAGFLLLEDLGDALLARGPAAEAKLYEAAIDTLAALHADPPPLSVTHGAHFRPLPAYGMAMLTMEFTIALDWWAPLGGTLSRDAREEGLSLFEAAMAPVSGARNALVMRDYHAENLIWLPERRGVRRIGLLDYQGAHRGHGAYDLASILEDARRDIPPDLADHLRERYIAATGADRDTFMRAFDTLSAQRNLKILGLFARLRRRDGKAQYLRYLPRVWQHLLRDLGNPALCDLRDWVLRHLPAPEGAVLSRLSGDAP